MNKQTYPIPDGCKAITMEIIDNTIVTTFEPQFKRGDAIYCEDKDGFSWVFILKEKTNGEYNPYEYFCCVTSTHNIYIDGFSKHPERVFRHSTPEEAQRLWDALAKEGKRWNPETMEVEEIEKEIPRAKIGSVYYSVDFGNRIKPFYYSEEVNDEIDKRNHETGNYFLTEEQAQRAADKLKQALADFWKEELK